MRGSRRVLLSRFLSPKPADIFNYFVNFRRPIFTQFYLLRHVNPCIIKTYRKGLLKIFRLGPLAPPQKKKNSKLKGVKQALYYDQPTVQWTHAER